jgi:hypothetical protein
MPPAGARVRAGAALLWLACAAALSAAAPLAPGCWDAASAVTDYFPDKLSFAAGTRVRPARGAAAARAAAPCTPRARRRAARRAAPGS